MKRRIPFGLCTLLAIALLIAFSPAQTGTSSSEQSKPATTSAKKSSGETKSAKTAAKIDINSASKDELMTLPGIGDATAQKIIDKRPYQSKNQLVTKKIVPKSTYERSKHKLSRTIRRHRS